MDEKKKKWLIEVFGAERAEEILRKAAEDSRALEASGIAFKGKRNGDVAIEIPALRHPLDQVLAQRAEGGDVQVAIRGHDGTLHPLIRRAPTDPTVLTEGQLRELVAAAYKRLEHPIDRSARIAKENRVKPPAPSKDDAVAMGRREAVGMENVRRRLGL